ncbi:MAG: CvpA family protein [Candidatus Omnitrophica bacterium]|nr:CvpA family protein [Candidatus Omnitrophota bacterium]
MNWTDIIVLICSGFLIWRGASRGFLGSMLGPLALIIATVVSVVYYILTKGILISLLIGLLGPFILAWIFRWLLRSWKQMTNPEGKLSPASRIGGALLTLAWGLIMIIITLLLLALIPSINGPLQAMYKDIHQSKIYHLIKPWDMAGLDKPSPQDDLRALAKDKRVQDIIHDPQITQAIRQKDFTALMSNPKIMALTQDPQMIKKIVMVYKQLMQQQMNSR